MQDYSSISSELKKICNEERVFRERYESALKLLESFEDGSPSLPNLSIDKNVVKIDFIGRTYQIEFRYSRINGVPSGEFCIFRVGNEIKNEFLVAQEFDVNGDVRDTGLSLLDDIETMTTVLSLVKRAVES